MRPGRRRATPPSSRARSAPRSRPSGACSTGSAGEEPSTAVVEMSTAAGRALLPRPRHDDPVRATHHRRGPAPPGRPRRGRPPHRIGCGGSATTDGGLGAFEAVGSPAAPARAIELVVACDVTTRFIDAATVFGPQKGATAGQVAELAPAPGRVAARYRRRDGRRRHHRPGRRRGRRAGRRAGRPRRPHRARLRPRGRTRRPGRPPGAGRPRRHRRGAPRPARRFDGKVPGGVLELARARGAHGRALPVLCIAGGADARSSPHPPPGLEVVSLTARFGRARARAETAALISLVTAEALSRFCP